jgi:hypothetical protein
MESAGGQSHPDSGKDFRVEERGSIAAIGRLGVTPRTLVTELKTTLSYVKREIWKPVVQSQSQHRHSTEDF